ncbi:GIY-YIG nuclease family protein, partial [Paenibacillus sp. 28ISP30-2]|nr:GIY-YIG nuclease family protein [Paenibacillus sp. 28ISP30-2]
LLKKKDSEFFDVKDALAKLEQIWLDRLQPYGEKGYL